MPKDKAKTREDKRTQEFILCTILCLDNGRVMYIPCTLHVPSDCVSRQVPALDDVRLTDFEL